VFCFDLWAFLIIFLLDSSFVSWFYRLSFCFVFNSTTPPPRSAACRRRASHFFRCFRPPTRRHPPPDLPDLICTIATARRPPPRRLCSNNRRTSAKPDLGRRSSSARRTMTGASPRWGECTAPSNSVRRRRTAAPELRLQFEHNPSSTEQFRRRQPEPKVPSDPSPQGEAKDTNAAYSRGLDRRRRSRGRRRISNKRARGWGNRPVNDLTDPLGPGKSNKLQTDPLYVNLNLDLIFYWVLVCLRTCFRVISIHF
jgi:hypothetical protein